MSNVAGNFTNYSKSLLSVAPGWGFYLIPKTQFDASKTGTGFDWSLSLQTLRIIAADSQAGDINTLTNGEYIVIGGITMGANQRPKFMICTDDSKTDVVGTTVNIAGGDGIVRPHSMASFIASYGFPFTVYAIGGLIGTPGYCTVSMLKAAKDMGAVIGSHCYSFATSVGWSKIGASNAGLRMLGPYGYNLAPVGSYQCAGYSVPNDDTAIFTDIKRGIDTIASFGFADTAAHFALPEGGYDSYVCSALGRAGVQTVGGAGSTVSGFGYNTGGTGGYSPPSTLHPITLGGTPWVTTSIQLDGSPIASDITAYVDKIIANQSVGACYTHNFSLTGTPNSNAEKLKALCDYLVTQSASIDVVSVDDWYKTVPKI